MFLATFLKLQIIGAVRFCKVIPFIYLFGANTENTEVNVFCSLSSLISVFFVTGLLMADEQKHP